MWQDRYEPEENFVQAKRDELARQQLIHRDTRQAVSSVVDTLLAPPLSLSSCALEEGRRDGGRSNVDSSAFASLPHELADGMRPLAHRTSQTNILPDFHSPSLLPSFLLSSFFFLLSLFSGFRR